MKPIIVSSIMILGGFAGAAMADCATNPPLTGRALNGVIAGKLVCGKPGANYPGGVSSPDRWQEEHIVSTPTSGPLFDYKLGPTDAVDQRKQVGTWSFNTADILTISKVTHSYTGGPSYTWDVRLAAAPNKYSFCQGNQEHVVALIVSNLNAGCGGQFP